MHYGILGMKWGKRKRTVSKTSSISRPPKQSQSPEKRRMSNKELKARVNRLKLEHDYMKVQNDIKAQKAASIPKTKSRIEKFVETADNAAKLGKSAVSLYETMQSLGVLQKK